MTYFFLSIFYILQSASFNPIAATNMFKALKRVSEARGKRVDLPLLQSIGDSANGDVRSAINTLQFISVQDSPSTCCPSASRKRKKGAVPKAEWGKNKPAASTALPVGIGARDSSLVLFHCLGKVLHAKRDPKTMDETENCIPLAKDRRHKLTGSHSVEHIIDDVGMTTDAFSLFLQENYLPFFSDIDHVLAAADHLSAANLLHGPWRHRDALAPYLGEISARGLMYANERPQSSGWKPIHKPVWYQASTQVTSGLFYGFHVPLIAWGILPTTTAAPLLC